MEEEKQCRVCKAVKLLDEFYKEPRNRDGHKNLCKVCDNQKSKEWRTRTYGEKRRKPVQPTGQVKFCKSCQTEKDTSEFYNNKSSLDGLDWECKICHGKHVKRWLANNYDEFRSYQERYYQERRRKQAEQQ